jgi:hypothetical protein
MRNSKGVEGSDHCTRGTERALKKVFLAGYEVCDGILPSRLIETAEMIVGAGVRNPTRDITSPPEPKQDR